MNWWPLSLPLPIQLLLLYKVHEFWGQEVFGLPLSFIFSCLVWLDLQVTAVLARLSLPQTSEASCISALQLACWVRTKLIESCSQRMHELSGSCYQRAPSSWWHQCLSWNLHRCLWESGFRIAGEELPQLVAEKILQEGHPTCLLHSGARPTVVLEILNCHQIYPTCYQGDHH